MGIRLKKSFTLIELIVAVGIVGLVLPAVFSIFFSIIRQQLVLIAFQDMKRQGDSIQRNIKNILQNRVAYITDFSYTSTDECPIIGQVTPTPTFTPILYIKDREGYSIKLYSVLNPTPAVGGAITIASSSGDLANILTKTYYLSSSDVAVSDIGFSCYRINEFTPATVSTKFSVLKTTTYKDISLPYSFKIRLRAY